MTTPYNPLNKQALAKSIEGELLRTAPVELSRLGSIIGAGVYALYYAGPFNAYAPISSKNCDTPIYVGKAIPKGGRKGGLSFDAASGTALASRLRKHAASITQASNLDLADFQCRSLVVDDIWIPLGENVLIENFRPLWNKIVDGFGNNDPGGRRATQFRSSWDTLHPGRSWVSKLAVGPATEEGIRGRIADYFAGKNVQTIDERDEPEDDD